MNISAPSAISTRRLSSFTPDLDLDGPEAMLRAERRHRAWRFQQQQQEQRLRPECHQAPPPPFEFTGRTSRFTNRSVVEPAWD